MTRESKRTRGERNSRTRIKAKGEIKSYGAPKELAIASTLPFERTFCSAARFYSCSCLTHNASSGLDLLE